MKKAIGNNYNVTCPHCGKTNNYVCQGISVEIGKISCFTKPCFYCKKIVYYRAQYEIVVIAESEG